MVGRGARLCERTEELEAKLDGLVTICAELALRQLLDHTLEQRITREIECLVC